MPPDRGHLPDIGTSLPHRAPEGVNLAEQAAVQG
jgi:hypothetical protein